MRCNGLHCEGCGHGGGAAGAVIALLVIIALALRKAWPAIVSAVEIAAWTVAGVTGAAIVITGGVLAVRAVRRRRARRMLVYQPGAVVWVVDEVQQMTRPLPAGERPVFGKTMPAGTGLGRPAFGEIERPRPQPSRWPLPGWSIGGDGDESRPR